MNFFVWKKTPAGTLEARPVTKKQLAKERYPKWRIRRKGFKGPLTDGDVTEEEVLEARRNLSPHA
jgi:hypothetical protein